MIAPAHALMIADSGLDDGRRPWRFRPSLLLERAPRGLLVLRSSSLCPKMEIKVIDRRLPRAARHAWHPCCVYGMSPTVCSDNTHSVPGRWIQTLT